MPQAPDLSGPGPGGSRPTIADTRTLADDWLVVTKYLLDVPGSDGAVRRQARVSAVRGSFCVESPPGAGTRVMAEIPCDA